MTDSVEIDTEEIWPDDAEEVDEGVVATWFVREGGVVEAGATLCEIQLEKVTIDVPAPASRTLSEIRVGENEE